MFRSRSVGERVIKRQIEQFEFPYYEGFNEIKVRNTSDVLVDLDFMIDAARNSAALDAHENPHHTLSISDHMRATWTNIIVKGWNEDSPVAIAAKYHDIGKYFTKKFDKNGIAHYYNHQNVGAYYYLTSVKNSDFLDKHRDNNAKLIAFLINTHMNHFIMDSKAYAKFRIRLNKECADALETLERADENAH